MSTPSACFFAQYVPLCCCPEWQMVTQGLESDVICPNVFRLSSHHGLCSVVPRSCASRAVVEPYHEIARDVCPMQGGTLHWPCHSRIPAPGSFSDGFSPISVSHVIQRSLCCGFEPTHFGDGGRGFCAFQVWSIQSLDTPSFPPSLPAPSLIRHPLFSSRQGRHPRPFSCAANSATDERCSGKWLTSTAGPNFFVSTLV
jgi:hypothetical protein